MLQTVAGNHSPGVGSGGFAQTFIHPQRGDTGEFAALVGRG
jgi:hypothetical protein